LSRLYENGSGNPVETGDGLFALDINNDGSKGPNGWKKKINLADPGEDVDVKIKSNGNKHQIEVKTTVGINKTKYIGTVSDALTSGSQTVLVGPFDDNIIEEGEKRVGGKLKEDGQDDGTWTGVRP